MSSRLKDLKPIRLDIKGRIIDYIEEPDFSDPEFPEYGFYEKASYSYDKDNLYKYEFPSLKLNYRISIHHEHEFDDKTIAGLEGYVHLTLYQQIKIGWFFGKNWFQNKENIKWLISIPISIATAYITTLLTK